jgi:hypothetical protein
VEAKIATSIIIGRSMKTDRPSKPGDGDDTVTCSIGFKGLRVSRDLADELAGWPIGCTNTMYNELGAPYQHTEIKLPKRVLMVGGKIEHRRESGASIATLQLPDKKSAAGHLHFTLDTPDDKGPTVSISGTIMWKAAGDEVDEVRPLLRHSCWAELVFKDENTTGQLFPNPAHVDPEQAASDRAKIDRKRRAAGEKPDTDDAPPAAAVEGKDELHDKAVALIRPEASVTVSWLQRQLKVGYNRAARIIEALEKEKAIGPLRSEGGHEVLIARAATVKSPGDKGKVIDLSLSKLEREAKEHARKHPRRDPPTPPRGGGHRGKH